MKSYEKLSPEENINNLVAKVRHYKDKYNNQKKLTKKMLGFLKFLSNNYNERISGNAKDILNEYNTELQRIKEEKLNNKSKLEESEHIY